MIGLELVAECFGYDMSHNATVQPFGAASEWPEHGLPFGFTAAPSVQPDWWDDCGVVD